MYLSACGLGLPRGEKLPGQFENHKNIKTQKHNIFGPAKRDKLSLTSIFFLYKISFSEIS
jgi:hypothetical protein